MNMNRLHDHRPVSCSDSLAALDRMSLSDALAIGLITMEENEAILAAFDSSMAVAWKPRAMRPQRTSILSRILKL